jgi:hypothetical protein
MRCREGECEGQTKPRGTKGNSVFAEKCRWLTVDAKHECKAFGNVYNANRGQATVCAAFHPTVPSTRLREQGTCNRR